MPRSSASKKSVEAGERDRPDVARRRTYQDRVEAERLVFIPIHGMRFRTYVEKVLLPTLQAGDIVVSDNLGSHRSKAVCQLIRSVGAKLSSCQNTRQT